MKVSIITATYNSGKTVRDTIESVLSQDYNNIEHIIIDGKSKDDTMDIVNEYKEDISTIISEPDRGIYDAMNKGITVATGDIIGILNSDDFFTSENIISQIVNAFKQNSQIEGVYGNLYYVQCDKPSVIVRHWTSNDYRPNSFFRGWHPAHPTLYLKKEVYDKIGKYDLDFPLAADFELMLRLFECERISTKYVNITMVRMRLGGASSKDYTNLKKNAWEGIKTFNKNTKECMRAFKKNNLKPPILYPFYRLVPKLLQYFK